MNYEVRDCIDAGSEYCPCHLAESGECILCSQLRDKNFCDCINWKGVCIYQEFVWNGQKAKEGRKEIQCVLLNKEFIYDDLALFTISVPHKLAKELTSPGSFVFLRNPVSDHFFSTPISIMDVNVEENRIVLALEVKGIKTKNLNLINEGEKILVRGPFWNGILGLKNLYKSKDGTSIVTTRGIGQAPIVPVLKKLYANGNKIYVILDKNPYKDIFIKKYLDLYNCELITTTLIDENGEIASEFKRILLSILKNEQVNIIHSSAADIINYNVLNLIGETIDFSCCNNAKMCCGEGVCGSCSVKNKYFDIERSCKLQIDPRNILEGRRLL
ncbi:Dihydroorotate dehydrogenase B, electron transfer subunit [Clostridium liquoris]|uniref:Dihydroorotate dehydrogenase B, electron transfer subunit n=1 Tax=Clostridium liquoris TaxID=1289519 RepID=A0A2T0B5Z9_9CLOT|nr:sulfide/dihydroorotate dehydrogenase-like FAD/NAD-binding protein [Clostridium liquoris]PRR79306.1 Dihydroorotate dehydrogenase B, electron transfer subunit [Clostridium liquoris]